MTNPETLAAFSVLIIDDSKLTRDMLSAILKSFGIQNVHHAEDGLSGFEILASQRIDIIISDVFMFPMHGLKFLEMLRSGQIPPGVSGQVAPDTPVIMITGKAMKSLADESGARWDAILDKPIIPERLRTEIFRLIDEKRLTPNQ